MADPNEIRSSTLLDAALDRVIPPDEFPGAVEAGVGSFIRGLWARGLDPAQEDIQRGLQALELMAEQSEGRGFTALGADVQDRILADVAQEPWFVALCELAGEGYYADPSQGANPRAASWAMIGYVHGLPEGPEGPPADPRER